MLSSININDFLKLTDVHLIDVRSIEKYNSSHIPGAINIPAEKLLLSPNGYLEKGVKYYLYCQHGMTSYNVGRILSKLGFDITNINGGYESFLLK